MLMLAGIWLWLQSSVSLIVFPIVVTTVVARIIVENKTVADSLPGYASSMNEIPYRPVPHVW